MDTQIITPRVGRLSPRVGMAMAALGVGIGLGLVGSGCSYSDREAYFDSRAAVIQPQAGSGSARLVMWPQTGNGRSALAVAERGGSMTDLPPLSAGGDSPR